MDIDQDNEVRLQQTIHGGVNGDRGESAITAVEFDPTGQLLAIGDKGGRVMVLKQTETNGSVPRYAPHAEFKSHEPEFDYLKSLEIEEKINQIRFRKPVNSSTFLLSTNDKTIKLWKVGEKAIEAAEARPRKGSELRLPRVTKIGSVVSASPKRVFSNACGTFYLASFLTSREGSKVRRRHTYHINSLSLNSDGETFVSSDDLRINLWNLEVNNAAFNIVDLKPANMEDLNEVITSSAFHPTDCNLLVYSSSKGTVKLFDLRDTALCTNHTKLFYEAETTASHAAVSFFSEIVSSISHMRFTSDGRYIVSRDYLTLKLWDFRMESTPVRTIHVHEHLRPRLCDLYESDCIFDKFECAASPNGDRCLTGSYNNNFSVFDYHGDRIDLNLDMANGAADDRRHDDAIYMPRQPISPPTPPMPLMPGNDESFDFRRRVLHLTWHPWTDLVAVVGLDRVHLYSLPSAPFRTGL